jgi:hypothetical protein
LFRRRELLVFFAGLVIRLFPRTSPITTNSHRASTIDIRPYSPRISRDKQRKLRLRNRPHDDILVYGGDPMKMTQTEFAHFVLTESESAARVIEAAGIKPQ